MVDRLLRHVESEVTKEILNPKGSKSDIQYDVTLVVSVGIARLRFGSAHTFTNPLIETRISQVSINSSALLSSKTGWFVPEKDFNAGDGGKLKDDNGNNNQIHFESVISASYLNAKHNHTESLIDPFPCYSSASFRAWHLETCLIFIGLKRKSFVNSTGSLHELFHSIRSAWK